MMASRLPLALCAFGAGLFYSANYEFNQNKLDQKHISSLNNTISSKAMRCPDKLTDDDKYKKVSMKGVMDHTNTIIMGPHKAPKSANCDDWGSFVYSPLKLESGQTVIANRGWIPRHKIHKYIDDNKRQPQNDVYEGMISAQLPSAALLFEMDQKLFKPQNDGIISRTWQFKNGAKHKKSHSKYVVIDILDGDSKKYDDYPKKLRMMDVFGMSDIEKQRKRHLTSAYSLGAFGAICCGVSFMLIKTPNKLRRFAMTPKKLLSRNRYQYH